MKLFQKTPALSLLALATALALTTAPMLVPAAGAAGVRSDLLVNTEWLADHLGDQGLRIVHVGGGREGYDQGHIPGAVFLPWKTISVVRDGVANEYPDITQLIETFERLGLGNAQRIVLYDEREGIAASRAFIALDIVGLGDRAALLDGQFKKWVAEGLDLSTEVPEVQPSRLSGNSGTQALARLSEMEKNFGGGTPTADAPQLVDSRPTSHYTGEEPGNGIPRGGHIPGAVHLYWKDHLKSSEIPELKSPQELLKLYADVGIKPGNPIVTYCRSGGQASQSYFTLKYLGFDVQMYDGSFLEWTASDTRPVEAGGGSK